MERMRHATSSSEKTRWHLSPFLSSLIFLLSFYNWHVSSSGVSLLAPEVSSMIIIYHTYTNLLSPSLLLRLTVEWRERGRRERERDIQRKKERKERKRRTTFHSLTLKIKSIAKTDKRSSSSSSTTSTTTTTTKTDMSSTASSIAYLKADYLQPLTNHSYPSSSLSTSVSVSSNVSILFFPPRRHCSFTSMIQVKVH